MQMRFLKKMGVIFALIALTSTQAAYADHSHHSHHSHSHSSPGDISTIWGEISNAWHSIAADLNVLFAEFGTLGVSPTTEALLTAYNTGDIAPKAQLFSVALQQTDRVSQATADQAALALDLYAVAAETYAIALISGGDVTAALVNWNNQTQNLINALNAIPRIKASVISPLVNQFQQAEIAAVQAYATANFTAAVADNNQSQALAESISDYIARRLLLK